MTHEPETSTAAGGPPWTVSFTIAVDDVVGYLRVAQRNLNLVGSAIAIALIGAGILVTAFANDTASGAVLMIVGVAFYAFGSIDYFDRWRAGRVGRSIIGSDATITIDEEGVTTAIARGSARIRWRDVTEVRQSKAVLVVRQDRLNTAWIPKRVFTSPEELADVQQFIAAHTGSAPTSS